MKTPTFEIEKTLLNRHLLRYTYQKLLIVPPDSYRDGGSGLDYKQVLNGVDKKLNRIVAVQECDATGDDSSNTWLHKNNLRRLLRPRTVSGPRKELKPKIPRNSRQYREKRNLSCFDF